jgi:hypothetical protein
MLGKKLSEHTIGEVVLLHPLVAETLMNLILETRMECAEKSRCVLNSSALGKFQLARR